MNVSAFDRRCSTCTLCCKVMGIQELDKPAGRWCAHCQPGQGCDIYGRHPPSCSVFMCLWLSAPGVPERLRPDRCNVVLAAEANGARLVAHCDPDHPMAWRGPHIYPVLKAEARRAWGAGRWVVAKAAQQFWLVTPDEDLDMGVMDNATPWRIELGPDGALLASILEAGPAGLPAVAIPRVLTPIT
jgi:hypothetical protein